MLQKHLKDDQWKQDASELIFESHSKGSEYVNKLFQFFNFFLLAKMSKPVFTLSLWGIVCRLLRIEKKYFIHFRISL